MNIKTNRKNLISSTNGFEKVFFVPGKFSSNREIPDNTLRCI